MRFPIGRFVTGAIAGLAATVPMTALMVGGKQRLTWLSQDALPPRQITRQALQAIGLRHEVSHHQELALTAVNHFAYGAGAGAK